HVVQAGVSSRAGRRARVNHTVLQVRSYKTGLEVRSYKQAPRASHPLEASRMPKLVLSKANHGRRQALQPGSGWARTLASAFGSRCAGLPSSRRVRFRASKGARTFTSLSK